MIHRILFYTHDSVGVGHVLRARAIISGIRRLRPDVDVLVLSGTSVPHVLIGPGVEVIKLPGVEKLMGDESLFRPRYVRSLPLAGLMRLRRRILDESFRWFRPDAVMVEHYLGGLLDEMVPILQGATHDGGEHHWVNVALSRGITGERRQVFSVAGTEPAGELLPLYDLLYCFDDERVVNRDGRYGGLSDADVARVVCLGRITDACQAELPAAGVVRARLGLGEKPIILFSLSRHGDVAGVCISLLQAFARLGLDTSHQVVFVIDPYLGDDALETTRRHPLAAAVRFLPFSYPLVDLLNASHLAVCRAGYNTLNEVLMTGVKAVVIPEHHPSGEQEARVATLPRDAIAVLSEEDVLGAPPVDALVELLARAPAAPSFDCDKNALCGRIIADMEAVAAARRGSSPPPSPRSPARAPGTAPVQGAG